MQTLIKNAVLVLENRIIENGWLLIENERIAGLGESATCPATAEHQIDANGSYLLPGLIDIHCDAIEKLIEPRPNVHFDTHIALHEVDRRLAGCGITTEFHALSLDDNEFGTRTVDFVRELAHNLETETSWLIRHEIHARFEITSKRGFTEVIEMINHRKVRLVSLMDHTPGQGQYTNEQTYRDYVKRTYSRTDIEVDALLAHKKREAEGAWERIEAVSQAAREAELALATHDDDTAAKVEKWPALGVTMSEFPTTMEAAQKAHELGLAVCMGAPNVLRGKSSGGNLSALEAIQGGVTNVLCADYYPAAMLASAFKLFVQDILPLPEAINLVSLNPARAVGLDKNFGSLEEGKMADIVMVNLNAHHFPKVQRLFVKGKERLNFS